jgi:hypothetical protein
MWFLKLGLITLFLLVFFQDFKDRKVLWFSTISFLTLFVFSLVFALVVHQFLKNNHPEETVPLAGYMSLFFGSIYGIGLFYNDNFLYAY